MHKTYGVGAALLLGFTVLGCGGGESATGLSTTMDSDGDGIVDAVEGARDIDQDGLPAYLDPDEGPSTGGTTGGDNAGTTSDTTTTSGGVTTGTTDVTSGTSGGTSTTTDAGTPYVGSEKPLVWCGDEECNAAEGSGCCDVWTEEGYGDTPSCNTECPGGQTEVPYDIPSSCDGPEDCGAGEVGDPNVCCFALVDVPVNFPLSLGDDGPGLARTCLSQSSCFAGVAGGAIPLTGDGRGILSCHKDADCSSLSLTCQPEAATDDTTAGGTPRPWVKLCK